MMIVTAVYSPPTMETEKMAKKCGKSKKKIGCCSKKCSAKHGVKGKRARKKCMKRCM